MQYQWYKQGDALLQEIRDKVIPENTLGIWFLGQESLAVRYGGHLLWIDPFFTETYDDEGTSTRAYPPPFQPGQITRADFVLGTHDHLDHIDVDTLVPLSKSVPESVFIVPVPHRGKLDAAGISEERILGAKAFRELRLAEDLTVTAIPAAHESYEYDGEGNPLCVSYVIRCGDITLLHAGDAVVTERLAGELRPYAVDVACLPINGADWKRRAQNLIGNMNARDAADLAAEIGADLVIPLHYDLFQHNSENPAVFAEYMHRFYRDRKFHIMAHGECFLYSK